MKHKPLTRQRSSWVHVGTVPTMPGWSADALTRRVSDGDLRALLALEPGGWHLSVSFANHKGEPSRYPTWDELAHARQELLPPNVGFVMHLPPDGEYVSLHDTTFHLHQHPPTANEATS